MQRTPLILILSTVFIALIGFGIVIPLLPIYAERFGASGTQVGLLLTIYSAMGFLLAPLFGRLSDRIGRVPVLVGALYITAISYVLFALADSLPMLYASRLLAGVGAADITVAQAYIADVTTKENRARGMGLFGAAFGVGFILGPAIAGLTAPLGEWVPMAIAALLAATTGTFALLRLPEPEKRGEASPSGPARLFQLPEGILSINVVYFFTVFAAALLQSMLVLFTLILFGWGASENGLFIAMFATVGAVIQGGLVGKLARRFGEVRLAQAGLVLIMIGVALVGNAGPSLPQGDQTHLAAEAVVPLPSLAQLVGGSWLWVFLFAGAILYSIGNAVTLPSLSSLASQRSPEGQQGKVLGTYQSAGSAGRIAGPLIGGLLFEHVAVNFPFFLGSLSAGVGLLVALLSFHRDKPDGAMKQTDPAATMPAAAVPPVGEERG